MKRNRLFIAVFVLALTAVFTLPAISAELTPLYTPPAGGTAYVLGTGITAVTNKYLKDASFVHEATSGTKDMLIRMQKRAAQNKPVFALFGAPDGYLVQKGQGDYVGKQFEALRAVCFVDCSDQYLVVPGDSPIRSYADVKGKKIAVGGPGSTIANNAFLFFEKHGVKKDDFKFFFYSYKEIVEGLQNGSIDGGFLGGNYPIPAYTELSLQHSVKIVPLEAKMLDGIIAEHPYYLKRVIPAGAYKGLDKDTPIFAFSTYIWAHTGMSDDMVYNFLKNLYEHRSEYHAVHKSAEKNFVLENLTMGLAVPLHPGAEKYLKEIGAYK